MFWNKIAFSDSTFVTSASVKRLDLHEKNLDTWIQDQLVFLTFDLGQDFEIKTSLWQQVKYFYNYMLTEIYEQTKNGKSFPS